MFAMRNGVIADALRKGGSPFHIIFGLNVPQLVEIASEFGFDEELAAQLWNNRSTRESLLLAPMLMDPQGITIERGLELASQAEVAEVADMLVHRLLRKSPAAWDLAVRLAGSDDVMLRYTAMRLLWHFIYQHTAEVRRLAEAEVAKKEAMTLRPASQIIEEIEFIDE